MRILWWIWLFLLPLTAQSQDQVTVLCYHTFIGKPSIETDFSLAEFKDHIDALSAAGYTFVTLAAVNAGQVSSSKNILLTFDDGHRSAVSAYEKVLAAGKIPAVFAIFPGTLDHGNSMSWAQVKMLAEIPGNAIVSHGYWHEKLFDRFARSHPQQFRDEIEKSKQVLQQGLGLPLDVFVYPYGVISQSAKDLLKKSGYRYAYGLAQRPLLIPLERNPEPFALPRTMMTRPIHQAVIKRLKNSSI